MTIIHDQQRGLVAIPTDPASSLQGIPAHTLPAHTQIACGFSRSTTLPDMDFETYSEAGYVWREDKKKWGSITGGSKSGIFAVGAPAYSEHPSTEVLSLAYDLKDGKGSRLWLPVMPPPQDLFDHIAGGGLIEAHNSGFEWLIWTNVCWRRMGWPALPLGQLRCSASKARAFGLAGALATAGQELRLDIQKDEDGKRLLRKFSLPRSPTKNDDRLRINPLYDPDGPKLYSYNDTDIKTESELSAHCPDLSPMELETWLADQRINMRGVAVDMATVENFITVFEQACDALNAELLSLTGGVVPSASKIADLTAWLAERGVHLPNAQSETIDEWLDRLDPSPERRALEIRAVLGSSSVKKLYAIRRMVSYDGRLRELFTFCGAERTGRFAGRGPQPQNLPSSGPSLVQCDTVHNGCGRYYPDTLDACPGCGSPEAFAKRTRDNKALEWSFEMAEQMIRDAQCRSYDNLCYAYSDPVAAIAGSLRGLFCAAQGKDLLCSDYSAIEAVVLACLAGEEWRIDVFRTHGKIYEMSASKITGVPFDDFMRHKKETDDHHPLRKKIGKVAELASGYQGGVGAWKNFGADKHLNEQEIKDGIKAWRDESPSIVKFWYGVEDCAVKATQTPGTVHSHRGIAFTVKDDVLYCRLLSGRLIAYHKPRVHPDVTPRGKQVMKLTVRGIDKGKNVRIGTYGGKLTENIVQATARDILTYAIVSCERRGYPVVMHVHDEIVCEVDEGAGSIEELEAIMADLPDWCKDWPIKAAGGWRGKRYRKD